MRRAALSFAVLSCACDPAWQLAEPVDIRDHVTTPGEDPFPAAAMVGTHPMVVWGAIVKGDRLPPNDIDATWARWHDGSTWSDFAMLGSRTQRPVLSGSADGTAIALVADGVTRFDGSTWSPPEPIAFGSNRRLAMNGSGRAVVVGVVEGTVQATFFTPELGWGSPVAVGMGSEPSVAMSSTGGTTVVWTSDGDLYGRVFDATAVAGPDTLLADDVTNRSLGQDAVGNSIILAGFGSLAQLVRWSTTGDVTLSAPFGSADSSRLEVNASGAAIVTWHDSRSSLWVVYQAPGAEPSAPKLVSSDADLPSAGPTFEATLDDTGLSQIVFSQHNESIRARSFFGPTLSFGFELGLVAVGGAPYYPDLAGTPTGEAVVVWNHGGLRTPEQFWAARFE